jgi:hypothetical protein
MLQPHPPGSSWTPSWVLKRSLRVAPSVHGCVRGGNSGQPRAGADCAADAPPKDSLLPLQTRAQVSLCAPIEALRRVSKVRDPDRSGGARHLLVTLYALPHCLLNVCPLSLPLRRVVDARMSIAFDDSFILFIRMYRCTTGSPLRPARGSLYCRDIACTTPVT